MSNRERTLGVGFVDSIQLLSNSLTLAEHLFAFVRHHTSVPLEALAAIELVRYMVQDGLPPNARHHTLAQLAELDPRIQEARQILSSALGHAKEPATPLVACTSCHRTLCTCQVKNS